MTASRILATARLDWRNASTPVSSQYDDVYFSADNGAAESDYVFLQHNQLPQRFQQLQKRHFTIAETGFGTGLNFLQSWRLWQQHRKPGQKLYFISTECYPLKREDLQQSLAAWPQFTDLSQQLIAQYPLPIRGLHTLEFSDGVTLILLLDDAAAGFARLLENPHPNLAYAPERAVDAWFLDGFAPAKNPDMWTAQLFTLMGKLSHRHTTFASFTAAGIVRRSLKAAGFDVQKVAGFGRKRDMICGRYIGLPVAASDCSARIKSLNYPPFWPLQRHCSQPQSVLVIGAGIAGCTTATTLAEAGLKVTLLDKHASPMQEASGNPQGVLFPKLSHDATPFAEFNLLSLLYALRYYRQPQFARAFNACGMLQLLNEADMAGAEKLCAHFAGVPEFIRPVSAIEASELAGTQINQPALYYPGTGWFKPALLREMFLQQPGIHFYGGEEVLQIQSADGQWQATTANTQYHADAMIICNAQAAMQLLPEQVLPVKNIRGQVTRFANTNFDTLQCVVCHDGYICPPDAEGQNYTCGASYELNDANTALSQASQDDNIRTLQQYLPAFAELGPATALDGRVAFRCAAADYLPLVGPLAEVDSFREQFADLRKNARAHIPEPGPYIDGLYLNIAYGSRGFSSAPIGAALLRAYLLNQPYPLPFEVATALHPARFLVRQIARG